MAEEIIYAVIGEGELIRNISYEDKTVSFYNNGKFLDEKKASKGFPDSLMNQVITKLLIDFDKILNPEKYIQPKVYYYDAKKGKILDEKNILDLFKPK